VRVKISYFFYYIFLLDVLAVPLSLIFGHLGYDSFWHFFKSIFILEFLFLCFYLIRYPSFDYFSLLLIFFIIYGASSFNINSYFFTHLYSGAIAFVGYLAGKSFFKNRHYLGFRKEGLQKLILLQLFLFIAYFLLYVYGFLNYFGVSSSAGLIFILSFLFLSRVWSIFGWVSVLLT